MSGPDPSIFERNLESLRERDPALAERVLAAAPVGHLEPARDGDWTLSVPAEDGPDVFLHSRYRPSDEATQWIEGQMEEGAGAYLLIGLGLGYALDALRNRIPEECLVVVVEPDLGIFRRCMEAVPLDAALSDPRVAWLLGLPRAPLFQALDRYTVTLFHKTVVLEHPPSRRAFPECFREVGAALRDFFAYGRMSLATATIIARITKLNLLLNGASYAFGHGIREIEGAAAGRPAVIVSAGPSLSKSLGRLREVSGRAVVIAVDTVLRLLLRQGIRPDFVTTLDYSKISRKYFEDLPDPEGVTLVCDPRVSYWVVDAWKGPVRFCGNAYLDLLLGEAAGDFGALPPGATVAHLAFGLARHLGCDPIVFVGQDLCYPHGITHMPGTPIHDTWRPTTNPFSTLEMLEWEEILRMRNRLKRIEDVSGNPVYTDEQMDMYLQRFERDFHDCPVRVINATEGGARIAGAEGMSFEESLAPFPPGGKPDLPVPAAVVDPPEDRRRAVAAALAAIRKELDGVRALYVETLDTLRKIERNFDDRDRVRKLLRRVDRARERMKGYDRAPRLVVDLMQSDEYVRIRRDREIHLTGLTGEAMQRKQLERDIEYVSGLERAAGLMLRLLEGTEARVAAFPETVAYEAAEASV